MRAFLSLTPTLSLKGRGSPRRPRTASRFAWAGSGSWNIPGVETPHPSPLPQGEREHAPAVIPGRGTAVILGSLLSFPCQRESRRNTRVPRGFSNVILLVFLSYCSSVILSVAKDMQFASFFFPLVFSGYCLNSDSSLRSE